MTPTAAPPSWLRALTTVAVCVLTGFGLPGVLLADAGWFEPVLVIPAGLVVSAVLVRMALGPLVAWRDRRATVARVGTSAHAAASAVCAIAVAYCSLNVGFASEQLIISRDPGVYVTTAKLLATEGTLVWDLEHDPFEATAEIDTSTTLGWFPEGDVLVPQFTHLLPVYQAIGEWVGGDRLLVRVNALIAGVAVLAFALLAWRWLPPWWVVLATLVLCLLAPQLWFARGAFSEIPMQALALGGLVLLMQARDDMARGPALVGGLVLGAVTAARIDALALLAVLPFWLAWCWRGSARRIVAPATMGVAISGVVGAIDVFARSRPYVRLHRSEVYSLVVFFGLAAVLALATVWLAPRVRRATTRAREVIGVVAPLGMPVVVLLLWWIRPLVQTTREAADRSMEVFQANEGLEIDPSRRYFEESVRWITWYVGPVLLMAAAVVLGFAVRQVLRKRGDGSPLALALVAVAGPTLLYGWKARAFPDHYWVMRRFLPLTLPALVVAGVFAAAWLWRRPAARGAHGHAVWPRLGGMVVAAGALAGPAVTLGTVIDGRDMDGMASGISRVCDAIGDDGAALVLPGNLGYHDRLPQTLRIWCDVPAASFREVDGGFAQPDIGALAAAWQARGRRLVLVGDAGGPGFADPTEIVVVNAHTPEQVLARAPRHQLTQRFTFVVGEPVIP